MLKNISLGMYYPGKTLLHRLQARTKLLVILFLVIALIFAQKRVWHFAPIVAIICLLCITVVVSGISFAELWRRTWLLFLLVVVGSIPIIFSTDSGDKTIISTIGPFFISYGMLRTILLVTSIVLIALLLSSRLPIASLRRVWRNRWLRGLRLLLILALLAALVFLWVVHSENAAQPFAIGPFPVTHGGVWTFVSFALVVMALYMFSLLLTMTTSPVALIEGLTMLLAPLRLLRLPVDDFALMTLIALRFIPTLFDEVEQLSKAQAARGADMTQGTIRERLQSLVMLFVPLMQGIFRRSEELATALEARGYQSDGKQTRLYERSFRTVDYLVMGSVVLVMVGSLIL